MPPPEVWGPPTWTLIHTLAEKIHETEFPRLFPHLFNHLKRICSFLPCPDCSMHAKKFLDNIKTNEIRTKIDFINIMYIFHNVVNVRKNKPLYNYGNMYKYKYNNVGNAFKNFVNVYNTNGNIKLLSDTFQRQIIIKDFKRWLFINIASFM